MANLDWSQYPAVEMPRRGEHPRQGQWRLGSTRRPHACKGSV
jgi:hypothetical protein